jgi:hypothetical protein
MSSYLISFSISLILPLIASSFSFFIHKCLPHEILIIIILFVINCLLSFFVINFVFFCQRGCEYFSVTPNTCEEVIRFYLQEHSAVGC